MRSRRAARPGRGHRVRQAFNYTVFEAARELGVTRHTIRRWIKQGLNTVAGTRPLLILGIDLNAYLSDRRSAAKRPCGPGQMFCMGCREPRLPVPGLIEYIWNGRSAGNLKGLCQSCGGLMNRRCAHARLGDVMPNLTVTNRLAPPGLRGCTGPCLNVHLERA